MVIMSGKEQSCLPFGFSDVYSGETLSDRLIEARGLPRPISVKSLALAMDGTLIAREDLHEKKVYGYAIFDSASALLCIPANEFSKLYSITAGRAVMFTKIEPEKSPIDAIKAANIRPAAVIFYGKKELDIAEERIARTEGLPVIISGMAAPDMLVAALKGLHESSGRKNQA